MNTLQFNFTIAFLKRSRALLEVATDEQVKFAIKAAFDDFDDWRPPSVGLDWEKRSIEEWFKHCYFEWANQFCRINTVHPDIRAALLHD